MKLEQGNSIEKLMPRSVFKVSGNLLRTGKPKLKMEVFENEKSEYKGHITVVMVEVQVELGQSISYTGREINSFIVRKRLWNNRMESQVLLSFFKGF